MPKADKKLQASKNTRKIASDSLLRALKKLLPSKDPISEAKFRDEWLLELKKNKDIFPDGWYIPPPHGIEMLFGSDNNLERINVKSIRPKHLWPRNDIFLSKENGIASVFAGPVDRETGIIGDFGLTLYFGKNSEIINHLRKSFKVTRQIANNVQVGMKLSDVANFAHALLRKEAIFSNLLSSTDLTGTNIGHTIPFSYEDMTAQEIEIFKSAKGNWEQFKDMISKKRKFINTSEQLKITAGMAITIEPRPQVPDRNDMPMVWFHTIVLFPKERTCSFHENREKEILTNFDEIFKLVGMDYMLN